MPIGARNSKGKHINKQVWSQIVTMLINFGILQVTEEHYYFNPDVDEYEIISREFLHKYTSD